MKSRSSADVAPAPGTASQAESPYWHARVAGEHEHGTASGLERPSV
jgi:hypothetical protein